MASTDCSVTKEYLLTLATSTFEFINSTDYYISNWADFIGTVDENVNEHLQTSLPEEVIKERVTALDCIRSTAKDREFSPADIKRTAQLAMQQRVGQCYETACITFKYITELTMGLDLNVELFNHPEQDHNFVVVNRAKNSDPLIPKTWGKNCLVLDRWANEFHFIGDSDFKLSVVNDVKAKSIFCFEEYADRVDSTPCRGFIPSRVCRQSVNMKAFPDIASLSTFYNDNKTVGNWNCHSPP